MNNTLHKKKYGKTLLSIFFAIVCVLYVLPVVMVAINSFKLNTFVKTETFALPNEDSYAGEHFLLLQRYAQTVKRAQQLGVDFIDALGILFFHRRGIIADCLEVNIGHLQVSPLRRGEREPVAIGFQSELEEPFRLMFLGRNQPHHFLIKPHRYHLGVDIGDEAIFVVSAGDVVQYF